jgi:DNA-binding transcriptional LysR family regulator
MANERLGRVRRLHALWSWLPAFRAVAETQHLPTAGEALATSPSALSRSIKLLEEEVGQSLFDRGGRTLELNAAGERLLLAVRTAMRTLDEALASIGAGQLVGPVQVSVPGPFAPVYVLPALASVGRRHPDLQPVVHSRPSSDIATLVRQGVVDVAVFDDAVRAADLTLEAIATITHGVYCGESHPLRAVGRLRRDQALEHAFAAPIPDARGLEADAWPAQHPRRVGLRVHQMQVAIDACARGDALAVLPDRVAARAGLHRLRFEALPVSTLFMLRRPPLPLGGRAEVVADAIREVAAAA